MMLARSISMGVVTALALVVPSLPGAASANDVLYRIVDLGTLGGNQSFASDIGDRGGVSGTSTTDSGDSVLHAFLWHKKGGMNDLGTLGGDSGQANSVNDAGEVVGKANLPDGVGCDQFTPEHAFLWKSGVMTDLGTLGGRYSQAFAINGAGQIVGNAVTGGENGRQHAALWNPQ